MDKFELELAELRPTLLEFTRKFTTNRDDSMDLVHETILRALSRKSKFTEDTNLKGWLYIIMRNTFINQYRKDKISRTQHVDDSYLNRAADKNTFNRPDGLTHIKEVWKVVNALEAELSTPFKMYVSGYKYQEIAEELAIPVGTVKNRIFRARVEMQNQLVGYRYE